MTSRTDRGPLLSSLVLVGLATVATALLVLIGVQAVKLPFESRSGDARPGDTTEVIPVPTGSTGQSVPVGGPRTQPPTTSVPTSTRPTSRGGSGERSDEPDPVRTPGPVKSSTAPPKPAPTTTTSRPSPPPPPPPSPSPTPSPTCTARDRTGKCKQGNGNGESPSNAPALGEAARQGRPATGEKPFKGGKPSKGGKAGKHPRGQGR